MLKAVAVVMTVLALACSGPTQPSALLDPSAGTLSGSAPRMDAGSSLDPADESPADLLGLDMAAAATTTFKFTGKVYSGGGYVPDGTKFTGSYKFNPAAKDTDASKGIGVYSMKAPYGMTITFPGKPVLSNVKGLAIRVRDNIEDVEDDYEIEPTSQTSTEMRILFRTKNKSAFTNDKLPLVPIKLSNAMFNGVLELTVGFKSVGGTITSLTK